MAGKLVRYQRAGDLHLTFSCYQRLPLLSTAPVRELFEQSLETMRARYRFVVTGYVVMPEHVHILLSEPKLCGLDKAIQALKLAVAVRLGKGRFWQARYYDFNGFTSRKVVEKLRYIHRNPVERGRAAEPGD
jgi:putative transposase